MTSPSFISEPIAPERGSFAPAAMARGLAALPAAFTWRGRRYAITECLGHSKVTAPEGHSAGGEVYLRRQEFVVRLDSGEVATIYFERQDRSRGRRQSPGKRWFLYTIASSE